MCLTQHSKAGPGKIATHAHHHCENHAYKGIALIALRGRRRGLWCGRAAHQLLEEATHAIALVREQLAQQAPAACEVLSAQRPHQTVSEQSFSRGNGHRCLQQPFDALRVDTLAEVANDRVISVHEGGVFLLARTCMTVSVHECVEIHNS